MRQWLQVMYLCHCVNERGGNTPGACAVHSHNGTNPVIADSDHHDKKNAGENNDETNKYKGVYKGRHVPPLRHQRWQPLPQRR